MCSLLFHTYSINFVLKLSTKFAPVPLRAFINCPTRLKICCTYPLSDIFKPTWLLKGVGQPENLSYCPEVSAGLVHGTYMGELAVIRPLSAVMIAGFA